MNVITLKLKESINNTCNSLREEFSKWKNSILIATIIWFVTTVLQIDRLYFQYDEEPKFLLLVKFSYLIFLVCFVKFFSYAKRKISDEDPEFVRGWQIFKVYFSILLFILLLVWPGTWQWDDLWILLAIDYYNNFQPWQHIFSGYFHDIFLQILPFPAGIILIRNFINAICVAFFIVKAEKLFGIGKTKNNILDYIIKLIPFLLPPVLMYQLSGYRIGQYVYLELVLLIMLIAAIKEYKKLSIPYLSLLVLLCVICSCWRTESFVYILLTCISFFFISRNVISNKRKIISSVVLIVGFTVCNYAQQKELGNSNYEIISLSTPCAELIRKADKEKDKELLDILNRVVSVETILQTKEDGTSLYWQEKLIQKGYTKKDYHNFLKAFVKLSARHPWTVINERWGMFVHAISKGGMGAIPNSYYIFENNANKAAKLALTKNWFAYKPPFKKIRRKVVNALSFTKVHSDKSIMLRNFVYGGTVPILCLTIALFTFLLQKKWYYLILTLAVYLKIGIVILTEPSPWFMYHLSFYFLGYTLLVYTILYKHFKTGICPSFFKKRLLRRS